MSTIVDKSDEIVEKLSNDVDNVVITEFLNKVMVVGSNNSTVQREKLNSVIGKLKEQY